MYAAGEVNNERKRDWDEVEAKGKEVRFCANDET
jgi:hypothetical protein